MVRVRPESKQALIQFTLAITCCNSKLKKYCVPLPTKISSTGPGNVTELDFAFFYNFNSNRVLDRQCSHTRDRNTG